jgi:hypothetical protein
MKSIQVICKTIPQSLVYSEYPNLVPQYCKPVGYSEINISIPIKHHSCLFKISHLCFKHVLFQAWDMLVTQVEYCE